MTIKEYYRFLKRPGKKQRYTLEIVFTAVFMNRQKLT